MFFTPFLSVVKYIVPSGAHAGEYSGAVPSLIFAIGFPSAPTSQRFPARPSEALSAGTEENTIHFPSRDHAGVTAPKAVLFTISVNCFPSEVTVHKP